MVFADLIFIYIFLPLNLLLYYTTGNKSFRNAILIFFSMFFYAWGEPVWIILLIFSASIDYIHGLIIENNRGRVWEKVAVVSSLVLNLGLLATFKYSGFIVSNVNSILGTGFNVPSFALPIGISFYTFQTISYVIDVYRGEVKAQKSYFKFLMFVSLYHQLVAGPIVRYSQVAHEIDNRITDIRDISTGITRFIYGLAKKVIVANTAGRLATIYMDGNLSSLSVGGAWFGIVMFSLQIYYDFSGYSDMAIGLGRMFGFHYGENFYYPYIAKNASEFWRRWHISLGSFFKDYLYIPLGGNRRHMYLNLLIVWFATGLWHGASWNFIIWGLFWGFLISLEKKFALKLLNRLPSFVSHIYLLTAIMVSWVLFYFVDVTKAFEYLRIMFGISGAALWDLTTQINIFNNIFWIMISIFFCMPWVRAFNNVVSDILAPKKQEMLLWVQPTINAVLLIMCTALLVGETYNPFLYFRF